MGSKSIQAKILRNKNHQWNCLSSKKQDWSGEKCNGITNLYHFIPADDAVFVDVIEPEAPHNFLFFRPFAQ